MPCSRFYRGLFYSSIYPVPSPKLTHFTRQLSLSLSSWSLFLWFCSYFVGFHHKCLLTHTQTRTTNNSIHKHWKHLPDNDLSLWGFCGFATYGLSISYQNNTTLFTATGKNRTHASAFSQLIHSIKSFNINVCASMRECVCVCDVYTCTLYSEFTLNSHE